MSHVRERFVGAKGLLPDVPLNENAILANLRITHPQVPVGKAIKLVESLMRERRRDLKRELKSRRHAA
jgi:hypothetical protein